MSSRRSLPKRRKESPEALTKSSPIQTVEEAFAFLKQERSEKYKVGIIQSQEVLQKAAKSTGLLPSHLLDLLCIIESNRFSVATVRVLIECLIPSGEVPERAALKVIASLRTCGLKSEALKILLLKWLLTVFDSLSSVDSLHHAYEIIFYFLEIEALCPYICHLLFLLTKKRDVVLYRVQRLLALQSKIGQQPHIVGLLRQYQSFKPDLVTLRTLDKRLSRVLNRWPPLIKKIHPVLISPQSSPQLLSQTLTEVCDIQHLDFLLSEQCVNSYKESLAPLEVCTNIPDYMMSPIWHVAVTACHYSTIAYQLDLWLRSRLYEELCEDLHKKSKQGLTLSLVANMSQELQENPPGVERVLCMFLETWDGSCHNTDVWALLSRWHPCPIDLLQKDILQPLLKVFCCSTALYQCAVIRCLTDLCLHWGSVAIPLESLRKNREHTSETDERWKDHEDFLFQLLLFVSKLCTEAIFLHLESHVFVFAAVFDFFEMVADLCLQHNAKFLIPPSPAVVYPALFSRSAFCVVKLCSLMSKFHTAIMVLKQNPRRIDMQEVISVFNTYLIDIGDTLWRGLAFQVRESSFAYRRDIMCSLKFNVPDRKDMLTIDRHPALSDVVAAFLDTQSDQDKTSTSVLRDSCLSASYLSHLADSPLHSITDFIHKFIRQR